MGCDIANGCENVTTVTTTETIRDESWCAHNRRRPEALLSLFPCYNPHSWMYVYPFQIVFPIVSELLVSIQTHSSWKRLSEGPQKERKNTFLYCVFLLCVAADHIESVHYRIIFERCIGKRVSAGRMKYRKMEVEEEEKEETLANVSTTHTHTHKKVKGTVVNDNRKKKIYFSGHWTPKALDEPVREMLQMLQLNEKRKRKKRKKKKRSTLCVCIEEREGDN